MDDRLNVKRTLRAGFEELVHLEEFVAIGAYPSLSLPDRTTDVWVLWPNLRRLALFDVPLDNHWLWWDFAYLEQLETVVLACPRHIDGANIKDQYYKARPKGDPALGKKLRVMLMDVAYELEDLTTYGWDELDPEGKMTVETYSVPKRYYGDESNKELVSDWVSRGAIDRSLWTWHGDQVGGKKV